MAKAFHVDDIEARQVKHRLPLFGSAYVAG